MKIIKPLRLTVMPRPYRWRGQTNLSVAVAVLVRQTEDGILIEAEQTLLKDVLPELDADEIMDFVMPKPHPEYMVSGAAYTAHQTDKTQCMVSVRVGDKRKDGLVFGDRYWIDGQISKPQPFDEKPLTWSNSFGGPTVEENPLGTGLDEVEVNGIHVVRLPNLESPTDRVHTKGQWVTPHNFGQIRVEWPQRLLKFGSCDEHWINTVGVGFFDDLQWSAFNAAPQDQIWHDRDQLSMDEPFEFWNMHPELKCWSGTLPRLQARCFIKRKESQELDEIAMRPTTAWFLPHRTSYLLIFHGHIPIVEDDALDVYAIMAGIERMDEPRSLEHYTHIYGRRTDFDTAAMDTLRDGDLMPADILAPWLEEVNVEKQALISKLTDRLRRDTGAYPAGGFIGPVKPVTLTELSEMAELHQKQNAQRIEKLKQERQEMYEETKRDVEKSGHAIDTSLLRVAETALLQPSGDTLLPQSGPPDLDAMFQSIRSSQSRQGLRAAFSSDEAKGVDTREFYEHSKRSVKHLYLYSAHFQQGVARVGPHRAEQIREQVRKKYLLNKKLSDMDLTGADLSGMDLSGANFTRTWLENADFTGANLSGAMFEETVLARASFVGARLDGALLREANISEARFQDCTFGSAHLEDVICETRTVFERCSFEGGAIRGFPMKRVEWNGCALRDVQISGITFEDAVLTDVAFADSHFDKVTFERTRVQDLRMDNCMVASCAAYDGSFAGWHMTNSLVGKCIFMETVTFSDCKLGNNVFRQTMFREIGFESVSFQEASLEQCDFSQARLTGCNLRGVATPQSLFVRTNLDMADLSGSDLMQGNFQKASFVGANLSGCNLFRADMSETLLDETTNTEGAYVRRTRLAPYRRTAGAATLGGQG